MDYRWMNGMYPYAKPMHMYGAGMMHGYGMDPFMVVHMAMKDPFFKYYAMQSLEHMLEEFVEYMYYGPHGTRMM